MYYFKVGCRRMRKRKNLASFVRPFPEQTLNSEKTRCWIDSVLEADWMEVVRFCSLLPRHPVGNWMIDSSAAWVAYRFSITVMVLLYRRFYETNLFFPISLKIKTLVGLWGFYHVRSQQLPVLAVEISLAFPPRVSLLWIWCLRSSTFLPASR